MSYLQIYGGQFQTLSGTPIAGGAISFTLPQAATVSGTAQICPRSVSFFLDSTGSVPQSENAKIWGTDSLTPSGLAYAVVVKDATGNTVYSINAAIVGAGPINLASLTPANSSVSYPGVVLLNPAGDQTIASTFNLFTNINGVLNATLFPGSDIGAQINAAYASLPANGGTIYVPAGTYAFSTPIVLNTLNKWVLLCGSPGATILQYTPTSGVAITLDYAGGGWIPAHGIRNLELYCGPSASFTNGGPNKTSEITAWSISSNVATFTSVNNYSVGDTPTLDGFFTGNFFNQQQVTVLASGLSGTQFKANFTNANASASEYGISYTTTTSATGIQLGGGSNEGAQVGIIEGVKVGGFLKNIDFSTANPSGNSFGMDFRQVSSVSGTFGYHFPNSANYENMKITEGMISVNSVGIYFGYSATVDLYVEGPSFDSNTLSGFYAPGAPGNVCFIDCHFENNGVSTQSSEHFINSGVANTTIIGGFFLNDNISGTQDWLVRLNSISVFVYGPEFYSQGQTVTQAILLANDDGGNAPQGVIAAHNNAGSITTAVGGVTTQVVLLNAGPTGSSLVSTLPTTTVNGSLTISGTSSGTSGELRFVDTSGGGGGSPNKAIRCGSGALQVLNSANNAIILTVDDSGNLIMPAKITEYNGVNTAGGGVPSIYGATLQKSESAGDTNVLTYTPPAAAGTYRINFTMAVSAQNTATLGWTAAWTDSNGHAQAPTNLVLFTSGSAGGALTVTAGTNGVYYGTTIVDINNSATSIVVKLTFTGTSFTAKVSATIEQLQ